MTDPSNDSRNGGTAHQVSGVVSAHSKVLPADVTVITAAAIRAAEQLRRGRDEVEVRAELEATIAEKVPAWQRVLQAVFPNGAESVYRLLRVLIGVVRLLGGDMDPGDFLPPDSDPAGTRQIVDQAYKELREGVGNPDSAELGSDKNLEG